MRGSFFSETSLTKKVKIVSRKEKEMGFVLSAGVNMQIIQTAWWGLLFMGWSWAKRLKALLLIVKQIVWLNYGGSKEAEREEIEPL